jgi:SPP1 family predicted phage head-tail adaptor
VKRRRVDPGELRHRLVLEENRPTKDGSGGHVDTWVTVATVWARVAPLSGLVAAEGMKATPRRTHEITIRHRADVHELMRGRRSSGRVLEFRAIIDPEERGEYMTITADELVPVTAPVPV